MPAITIIGDSRGAARNRPTSLPAEARSLSRMLRLLNSPQIAANALLQALTGLPVPSDPAHKAALWRIEQKVKHSIQEMSEAGWSLAPKYAEYNMALAIESVLQDLSSFVAVVGNSDVEKSLAANNNRNDIENQLETARQMSSSTTTLTCNNEEEEDDDDSNDNSSSIILPTKGSKRTTRTARLQLDEASELSLPSLKTNNKKSYKQTSSDICHRAAVVSDSSSTEETATTGHVEEEETSLSQANVSYKYSMELEEEDEFTRIGAVRFLWATILESMHLQVASRTTRVWGKKKIYEVYQFSNCIQDMSTTDLSTITPDPTTTTIATTELVQIRQRLEAESCRILAGVLKDTSVCRVYTTIQPLEGTYEEKRHALCVQFNLEKPLDLHDERLRSVSGEKKKKAGSEFVAILVPGSNIFALTASRAPSRSRHTPYILAILEHVLTGTDPGTKISYNAATAEAPKKIIDPNEDLAAKRVGDLSGTEPTDLLRAARSMTSGEAVGRFAFMAEKDKSNPLSDLHTATTADMLCPANYATEKTRLMVGSAHPGNPVLARAAATASNLTNGSAEMVATNNSVDVLLVDHTTNEKHSRKRSREEALGGSKDCPSLQRVCWKWSGETTAASSCWLQDNDKDYKSLRDSENDIENLPKTKFKCAVVMKGENVMQGIQALIDAGLMEGPLPDFIRDAPSMGGTIRVDHGSFVSGTAPFEEV